MKSLKELVIPLGDAENYRQRSDKSFLMMSISEQIFSTNSLSQKNISFAAKKARVRLLWQCTFTITITKKLLLTMFLLETLKFESFSR